ncbi:MAG: hypothetical protein AB8C95_13355 [Phycisphaeraceae bacterium]
MELFNLFYSMTTWFLVGLARLLAALLAIPFVFFMPRGPGFAHLTYFQTLRHRLRHIGKSILTAFTGNPLDYL